MITEKLDRAIIRRLKQVPGDWSWDPCLTRVAYRDMILTECRKTGRWQADLPVGAIPLGRRAQRVISATRDKARQNRVA